MILLYFFRILTTLFFVVSFFILNILIIFCLPVNYLFLPLLDDIKKAYRTNLQTEKNHAHAKALKYKNVTNIIPVYFFIYGLRHNYYITVMTALQ